MTREALVLCLAERLDEEILRQRRTVKEIRDLSPEELAIAALDGMAEQMDASGFRSVARFFRRGDL